MNVRIDSVVSINQTRLFFMCKYMSSVYMYISSAIIILLMYIVHVLHVYDHVFKMCFLVAR